MERETFFTHDRAFYKAFFSMMAVVALQNLVAYSGNMNENIILGSYSQEALSGAATVNQIFFMVQQFSISFCNALVAIAAQYWGQGRPEPVRALLGIALKLALAVGAVLVTVCALFPAQLVGLFTTSEAIIDEGCAYLRIICWTFPLYFVSQILMAGLRVVGTVRISFFISLVSLVVDTGATYLLVFGKLGLPELGIVGAGIGTVIGRVLELGIAVVYVARFERKISYFGPGLLRRDAVLERDYLKIYLPIFTASVVWGVSVPIQTAILGHLSDDAIAANSVATTFYQYLKVVVQAMSSTSAVLIGQAVGRGDEARVREQARTMAALDVGVGAVLALLLVALKDPLLSLYSLSESATELAGTLILIMAVVMLGMSYQMPVSFGIMQGAGDATFTMKVNMVSTWLIVLPLSFAAAFWWKLPVSAVVAIVQSDQVFKCLPVFLHFRSYTWMKKLTREE